MELKYARPTQAAAYLKISKATLYRWRRIYDNFPKQYKIGDRTAVWNIAELEAFIQSKQTV